MNWTLTGDQIKASLEGQELLLHCFVDQKVRVKINILFLVVLIYHHIGPSFFQIYCNCASAMKKIQIKKYVQIL